VNSRPAALGFVEVPFLSITALVSDHVVKSAGVRLLGKEKIGAAYVTVIVRGDVAAVKAAVEAGAKVVDGLGKLIAAHVIARPHADLLSLLPK